MHEFSIAVNIVDLAAEYAEKEKAAVVREIEIEVGELSGVVIEALEFCMEAATRDSILENARVRILPVEGRGRCRTCHQEFGLHDLYSACPECGAPSPELTAGGELRVKSLLVD
jgi:hydrogenase nickel incorporation protein HypA/HybF